MSEQTPPPAAEPAADPVAELAALHGEVAALQQQLAQARQELELARKEAAEATLRARADLDNTRRRLERDAENSRKFVLEKFAGELLGVVDSLERGLAATDAADEALRPAREGLELTRKQLVDTLRRFEVEEVDPRGQPFNPQLHEAMAQLPSGELPPNTVLDVMQKGYTLAGRLLRPALVAVSRAP